jgi:hypothetical protein
MAREHSWQFKRYFRSRLYGWGGSRLACQRLKEAVAEIKAAARTDPVKAADGVVSLLERIWPAFEHIDASSGALGTAVWRTQEELLPVVAAAPADRETRQAWLERLVAAIEEDGVDYLSGTQDYWGQLCASPELASEWADRYVNLVRSAWSDREAYGHAGTASLCLSSLLAAGRYRELLELLALQRFPFWPYQRFGLRALMAEGRLEEALAFAEASRGLNQPEGAIDAACEEILLRLGRADEAYERYAIGASRAATGLATFRAIARKYPSLAPEQILRDLSDASGEPGLWFAAAKDAGLLDLALEFAKTGRTDPRTLGRASRDFLRKNPRFSLDAGRIAIGHLLRGYGYELTGADAIEILGHFLRAAGKLGVSAAALDDVRAAAKANDGTPFAGLLLRHCQGGESLP